MSSDAMVKQHKTAKRPVRHGNHKTESRFWIFLEYFPRNHHLRSSDVVRPEVRALF